MHYIGTLLFSENFIHHPWTKTLQIFILHSILILMMRVDRMSLNRRSRNPAMVSTSPACRHGCCGLWSQPPRQSRCPPCSSPAGQTSRTCNRYTAHNVSKLTLYLKFKVLVPGGSTEEFDSSGAWKQSGGRSLELFGGAVALLLGQRPEGHLVASGIDQEPVGTAGTLSNTMAIFLHLLLHFPLTFPVEPSHLYCTYTYTGWLTSTSLSCLFLNYSTFRAGLFSSGRTTLPALRPVSSDWQLPCTAPQSR